MLGDEELKGPDAGTKPDDERAENVQPDDNDMTAAESTQTSQAANEATDEVTDEVAESDMDPLSAALAERDELKDQALRALAEVENMRRRTERELQNARKYGHLNFARDMLTSIDNLGQAVALAPDNREGLDEGLKNLLIGVEMIHTELRSVLERHHISQITPEGEKFDYNLHQAMFEVPTDDVEPGTVVQVAQPGYQLHDRLLRPAMVGVAKAASTSDDNAE